MPFYSGGSSPAVLAEFLAANSSFGSTDCQEFTSADYKAERSPIARQSRACLQTQWWGLNWMRQVDMRSVVCGTRGFDG